MFMSPGINNVGSSALASLCQRIEYRVVPLVCSCLATLPCVYPTDCIRRHQRPRVVALLALQRWGSVGPICSYGGYAKPCVLPGRPKDFQDTLYACLIDNLHVHFYGQIKTDLFVRLEFGARLSSQWTLYKLLNEM